MNFFEVLVSFLSLAIKFSTVFLFGATGEIINQKSGHLNMGTPGIMYLGALGGVLGERIYIMCTPVGAPLNPFLIVLIPVLFAIIFGAFGGLIFSFFTVTLHCNQNVTGLTLTTLGVGVSCLFISGMPMDRMAEAGLQMQSAFPNYQKLGWFGEIFLSQSWFTYLGIAVAIATAIIISKTKVGLNLRAVGENPGTSDASGVNVNGYKYVATTIGAAICGLGGVYYLLELNAGSAEYTLEGYGWIAVALVIFSIWNTGLALAGSFIFAIFYQLPIAISIPEGVANAGAITKVISIIPYVVTILVLIVISLFNKRETQPPAALGLTYFREDR